jgi:hypothetical protein
MSNTFETLNIQNRVIEIMNKTSLYKKFINTFLNSYKLNLEKDNIPLTINDFIEKEISSFEYPSRNNNNYTYWVEGSLSWDEWYKWYATREEIYDESTGIISMETSNYNIRYIITEKPLFEEKVNQINDFLISLCETLKENGIYTKIVYQNVQINDSSLKIIYDYKALFRQPFVNIKLVFDNPPPSGGAKAPKGKRRKGLQKPFPKFSVDFREKIRDEIDITKLQDEVYIGKTVVEFDFELFYKTQTNPSIDIELFKKSYLQLSLYQNRVNRLNDLGLITFSYLRTTDKSNEFDINVDKYRQQMFIKKKYGKHYDKLCKFLNEIVNVYKNLFKNQKSYNTFFIEKLEKLFNKYSASYYENFIDIIEKWYIAKFRPAINAFIIEFNTDLKTLLFEIFNEDVDITLFIAGGDAMRRYDDNISFTKDIDTKFYVRGIINKYVESGKGTFDEIKRILMEFVAEKVVKLRNYLEENIETILNEECLKGLEEKILSYRALSRKFEIELYNHTFNEKNQYFRVRKISQNENFPVDLYSIDFRTYFIEYDNQGQFITKRQHMISLLDVVFQDNPEDIHYPEYVEIFDNIPVASRYFLLKDFYTTYTTDKRALARISSDKYKKDITRFNKLLAIYKSNTQISTSTSTISIDKIDELISIYDKSSKNDIRTYILSILLKLKEKTHFSLCDYIIMLRILKSSYHIDEDLKKEFNDIIYVKKNLLFEPLNQIDELFHRYIISTVQINNKQIDYLEIFKHYILTKTDVIKYSVPFNNNLIIADFNKISKDDTDKGKKRKITQSSSKKPPSKSQKTTSKPVPRKGSKKASKKSSSSSSNQAPQTPTNSPPPLPPPPPLPSYSPPPLPPLPRIVSINRRLSPSPPPAPAQVTRSGRVSKKPSYLIPAPTRQNRNKK